MIIMIASGFYAHGSKNEGIGQLCDDYRNSGIAIIIAAN
jgi:hypothetical protein